MGDSVRAEGESQGASRRPDASFWSGRACVVTGGSGFIGGSVLRLLRSLGATCVSYDVRPAEDRLPGVSYVEGSIADTDRLAGVVDAAEVLFSLGGTSGATGGLDGVAADLEMNCASHVRLLQRVADRGNTLRIVFPGSRLEYGHASYLPIDEAHPVSPQSAYALHKYVTGSYHMLFARDCGLHAVVLRLSNPYGPHPCPDGGYYSILNRFLDTAAQGGSIKVFGDGSQLRDYVYIDDVAEAMLLAAEMNGAAGRTINVGSGTATSIAGAARTAIGVARSGSIEHVPWPEDAERVETGDSYFSIQLAHQVLGWAPRHSLEEGMRLALAAGCDRDR